MANKFTQSILERQYKEAQEEKRTKKKKAAAPEPTETAAVAEPEVQPEPVVLPQTPKETEKTKVSHPVIVMAPEVNLDAYIIKETERVAKNKTFYLDQAVIEAIRFAAKKQKITDSKLVNDILRKVLGVKND